MLSHCVTQTGVQRVLSLARLCCLFGTGERPLQGCRCFPDPESGSTALECSPPSLWRQVLGPHNVGALRRSAPALRQKGSHARLPALLRGGTLALFSTS